MSRTKNQNKTKPTKKSAASYIKTLSKKEQAQANFLLKVFKEATDMKPVMWGHIFGFGEYHYLYDSGREGDFMATGFAIRKTGPVLYIMPGYKDYSHILEKVGPHKLGKSCLYLKNVEDVNPNVLKRLIKAGLKDLAKRYPIKKT